MRDSSFGFGCRPVLRAIISRQATEVCASLLTCPRRAQVTHSTPARPEQTHTTNVTENIFLLGANMLNPKKAESRSKTMRRNDSRHVTRELPNTSDVVSPPVTPVRSEGKEGAKELGISL